MTSRESRFLAVIDANGLSDVSRLLAVAKTFRLTLGRVISTSSSFNHEQLSVREGDCLIELIGLNITNPAQFLTAASGISRYVNAIATKTDTISVSYHVLLFSSLQNLISITNYYRKYTRMLDACESNPIARCVSSSRTSSSLSRWVTSCGPSRKTSGSA